MKSNPPGIGKGLIAGDRVPDNGRPKNEVFKDDKEDTTISVIRKRRETKEALRMSAEVFSKVFSASPNPICVVSIEGESFIDINESYTRFTGYTREETIGRTSKELGLWVNEDDLKTMKSTLLQKGRMYNRQFASRMKNGETRTGLFSAEIVGIAGKRCMVLVVTDITEQKWAEDALKQSEEFTSSLLTNTPNPILVAYPDSSIKYVNPAFEKLTGFTLAEITEMKMPYPWWPEETKREIVARIKESDFTDGTKKEMAYQKKSGERFWVELNPTAINKNGKREYSLVNWVDITERKQIETALRESEEKFSRAFSSASDAMAIISSQGGNFLEVNNSYVKLSGYSREELIGHNADELNMWGKPEDRQKILRITVEKGQAVQEEFAFRTKWGGIRTCLFSAETINVSGERRMIVVVQDITERKQMETALRESEEKFSKAFNASANAISIKSLITNRYLDVNESFTRFTGYTREEVVGHKIGELNMWVKPEEKILWTETLKKEGRVINQEFSSRMKSGEIRYGLGSSDVINIGGEPCRMMVITDITKRKKAEEALKDSEEKFSKAFYTNPDCMAITRLDDGRYIEANDSLIRFTGYSREDILGKSFNNIRKWDETDSRNLIMEKLRTNGRVVKEECSFCTKSGEIKTMWYSAETLKIGEVDCVLSITTDITERKKAEESLRLLSSVTQQVTDSIVVNDPDFKITYMNKAAQDLFGYSIDEVMGTDISLFDAEPVPKRVRKDIMDTVDMGKTWEAVFNKRRKDGSTFLCDCRRSPLFDEAGRLASYIIVYRDITEQKETEAKLKAQKQLVDSILTSMPEGVIVTDSSDRIMLANESFRRIFHTGKKIIDNKSLTEVLRVEHLFDLYSSVKRGNTDIDSLEFRYKVKDTEKIIACSITRMDSERMLLIFSDISRIREEEDKLYLRDRLASLGEMAAGLAHELNNPLTGILTLSQLLVNSDLPDEQKEDMQCVYSEAKRAANIVKNVLLFTRNNSYENGKASVNEVVKEVLRLREHEEKVNNINAVTNLQDNLPLIQLDKYQLQQICLNIILNAEAAIEETKRPGTLTITTEKVGNHVNIIFSDNGCGIKKQVLPRIFDPFFTTKEVGKGTGLGLSICYGIIVKHNGKISVKTQVGEGTTFTIRIPVAY